MATSVAICSVNIHLLASSISISGSGNDELVDRNRGLPFSIVLEEVISIVEVTERTPSTASRLHGHPVPDKTGCQLDSQLTASAHP